MVAYFFYITNAFRFVDFIMFFLRVKDLVLRIHSNDQVGFEPEKIVSAMRLEFSTINNLEFG